RMGALVLDASARPLLRGDATLQLRLDPTASKRSRSGGRRASGAPPDVDPALWAQLRAFRMDLANVDDVPAYRVFTDATLAELAHRKPTHLADMLSVSGVGEAKLERYGDAFVAFFRERESTA
ncbi:MAG: HRDC domain-containing protein, partial [Pseudomonadota bacterium]